MIRLFTDTSANLPAGLIAGYDLTVIPFTYTIDGKEMVPDPCGDFDGRAYYDAMRAGSSVKTSMINMTSFEEPMRAALAAGDDVLYIGMSGGISGTARAAALAVQELKAAFPERRIAAVDSYAASLGEGLLVLEAARMREAGADFPEILARIEERRHTMCQYFTVDDLEYLMRGGRIGRVTAFVGTVLRIRPLLTGDAEGRIVPCGKVRGRKQSLTVLADYYDKLAEDKAAGVGIAHADDEEGAAFLTGELRKRGFTGECLTVCYEPVTGAHVGPGTVALFFPGIHK